MLTSRDLGVLGALGASKWLTTEQVARLCFGDVTLQMVRKRLRALKSEGFVLSVQGSRSKEMLHALGPQGREVLKSRGWAGSLTAEADPPVNLGHFTGINDIRIAFTLSARQADARIGFFFAHWELGQYGWRHTLLPDAASEVVRGSQSVIVLIEYDRGTERPDYLVRKFVRYSQGLDGFPFSYVLTVTDSVERMDSLQEAMSARGERIRTAIFGFLTLECLRERWSVSELFG